MNPLRRPAAILLIACGMALGGCVSHQSYQDAVAVAAKHSHPQAASLEKSAFAHLRSVSLLAGKITEADLAGQSIALTGLSGGQAACVSRDGYLLTAAHVAGETANVFVFVPKSESPGGWWKADPLESGAYLLTNRAGATRSVSSEQIMVRPIRVVQRFPGTDLALLHVSDFRPTAHFALADAPPPAGATIWAHCAPANAPPACVSGKIFGPVKSRFASFFVFAEPGAGKFPGRRDAKSWRTLTNAVVQCGDSGGAAFDDRGCLAGVFSTGAITPGIFGRPRSLWTAFEGVPAQQIHAAIREDRERARRKITSSIP